MKSRNNKGSNRQNTVKDAPWILLIKYPDFEIDSQGLISGYYISASSYKNRKAQAQIVKVNPFTLEMTETGKTADIKLSPTLATLTWGIGGKSGIDEELLENIRDKLRK